MVNKSPYLVLLGRASLQPTFIAEGPLEMEWGDNERSEGLGEPSGNMSQQFSEVLDDGPGEIDLTKSFQVCRETPKDVDS